MEPLADPSAAPSLATIVADRARELDDAAYLLDARGSRVLTFAGLARELSRTRDRLGAWGLRPGDRVGLVVSDPLDFATWFVTGVAAGLWVAPLDPAIGTALDRLDERVGTLSLRAIVADHDSPGELTARWLDASGEATTVAREPFVEAPGAGGVVLSSSGTTGRPKVMLLRESQLTLAASLVASHHRLDTGDRGFNPLPLWHVNAEVVGLLASLDAGSSLVLDDRFHRTGFWKVVDEFDVTWVNAVPAIVARLVAMGEDEVVPRRIRFVRSASAPLPATLAAAFEAKTGVPVVQSYGMTEAASQICVNPVDGVRKMGSVGQAAGVEVRVVGAGALAAPMPTGEVGHVEIKGPTVITSYESDEYAGRFSADGWLRTGDLGYLDDEGYLFLVGRDDDVINRGGEKIYPFEIENVLAAVGGVGAVVVVGEPDEVFGQVPVAFVQPADVAALEPAGARELVGRIRAASIEAFAKTRRPARVKVVEAFPTHATGKISKHVVRHGGIEVLYAESLEAAAPSDPEARSR